MSEDPILEETRFGFIIFEEGKPTGHVVIGVYSAKKDRPGIKRGVEITVSPKGNKITVTPYVRQEASDEGE
jgi:hypothetical protein